MPHRPKQISYWIAAPLGYLLVPFVWVFCLVLIPVALVGGLLGRLRFFKDDLKPEELARYLRDLIEDKGDEDAWDRFENMKLKDPLLEAIRQEAATAGPPNADFDKLRACLARAEALSA
jgi:hypothetical protein